MLRILKEMVCMSDIPRDVDRSFGEKIRGKAICVKPFISVYGETLVLIVKPDNRRHALSVDLMSVNDDEAFDNILASEHFGKFESMVRLLNYRHKTERFRKEVRKVLKWADDNIFSKYCMPLHYYEVVSMRNGWYGHLVAESKIVAETMIADYLKARDEKTSSSILKKGKRVDLYQCAQISLIPNCL